MLNHLMLATLDGETQREWELITASPADTPTTAELVTFLESRLELLQTTQSLKTATASSRSSHPAGSKVGKPACSNSYNALCAMGYMDCLNVTNLSSCNLSNATLVPNN
jgi:hypothetical protein